MSPVRHPLPAVGLRKTTWSVAVVLCRKCPWPVRSEPHAVIVPKVAMLSPQHGGIGHTGTKGAAVSGYALVLIVAMDQK